jgi:hypothetical protein
MTDINEENKDLIENKTPLGLLDKEARKRMIFWPHGWQIWSSKFDAWADINMIYFDNFEKVLRAKPAPSPRQARF